MADSSIPLNQRLRMEMDKMIEGSVSGKPNAELLRNAVKQKLATIDRTPDHPVYATMIQEAITDLNEESGSTRDAISEYILEKYDVVKIFHTPKLMEQLEKLVERNELGFTAEGRYAFEPKAIAPEKVKRRRRGRPPKSQKEQRGVEKLRDLRVKVKKDQEMISRRKMSLCEKAVKSESLNPCRGDEAPTYREWWLQEAAKLFSASASEDCDETLPLDTISYGSSESSESEDQVTETVDLTLAELRNQKKINCNSETQVEQNLQLVGHSECESMREETIETQMETQEKNIEGSQTSTIPEEDRSKEMVEQNLLLAGNSECEPMCKEMIGTQRETEEKNVKGSQISTIPEEDCSKEMVEAELQNLKSEKNNGNSESQVEQSLPLIRSSESTNKETIETQKEIREKNVEASEKLEIPEEDLSKEMVEAELQNEESEKNHRNSKSQVERRLLLVRSSERESMHTEITETQMETKEKTVEASKELMILEDHTKEASCNMPESLTNEGTESEAVEKTRVSSNASPMPENVIHFLKQKFVSLLERTRELEKEQRETIDFLNSLQELEDAPQIMMHLKLRTASSSKNIPVCSSEPESMCISAMRRLSSSKDIPVCSTQPIQNQQLEISNLQTPNRKAAGLVEDSEKKEKQGKSCRLEVDLTTPDMQKDNILTKKRQYPNSKIPICLGIPRFSKAPAQPSERSSKRPKYARVSSLSSKTSSESVGKGQVKAVTTPEISSSVRKEGTSSAYQESETSLTEPQVESEPSGFKGQSSGDVLNHNYTDNSKGISTPRGGSTSRGRKRGGSQKNSRGGITPRGRPKVNRGGRKQTRRPKVLG